MRNIKDLSKDFKNRDSKLINNLMKAQQKQAQITYQEIYDNSPVDTGEYRESIYVTPTELNHGVIETSIASDMQVVTKDGKSYNLAFLIETGTDPHAIPNAFGWGDKYGYDSERYKRTLQSDWHPGTDRQDIFYKAKINNEASYRNLIAEATRDAMEE